MGNLLLHPTTTIFFIIYEKGGEGELKTTQQGVYDMDYYNSLIEIEINSGADIMLNKRNLRNQEIAFLNKIIREQCGRERELPISEW